jgi:hypothetical protein
MKYDFNGKILNIPDKELENSMKILDISKEEAIQMWLEDNDYEVNETVEELTEKAKKNIKRYEQSDKKRKTSTKERKVDDEKKVFLNGFRIFAEGKGATVTSTKNEAEFSFSFGDNDYTVKLVKHRKK